MDVKPQMSLWRQWGTVPNVLSSIRLALVPVFLLLLVNEKFTSALIVLAAAGITDYLDGYFARKFNQVTRLGQLLDPAADRLYIFSTLIGLALTGLIPTWLAGAIIARDVMLLAVYPVLATHGYGPLPVHYLGKAGTFALLYAFPLLMMAHVWKSAELLILPVAWAFAWWGVGLYWWAGAVYVLQVRQIVKFGPEKTH
ncbi:MAG: CDP-alcohol phosphatidyltransferase family protein [Actinomycetales bacterium]|nr:CDP-alcohol phosphatidyltransferase family protein [Actinomycetales bacterium]